MLAALDFLETQIESAEEQLEVLSYNDSSCVS